MNEDHPIPLEELLAHAAWVTGLARSLLFDQARVDDVVQQTWMVAMERRPWPGPTRPSARDTPACPCT